MNRPAPDMTRTTGDDGRSAAPLDELVCAALGRRVRRLRIEVREGGLVLRGRADSDHAKLLAQYAVMAVTDLPLGSNQIEVVCLRRGAFEPNGAESGQRDRGPTKTNVLLAIGDVRLRSAGDDYLTDHGYVVATATGGVECLTLLREFTPDVVILDTDLLWGGADGVVRDSGEGRHANPRRVTQLPARRFARERESGRLPGRRGDRKAHRDVNLVVGRAVRD